MVLIVVYLVVIVVMMFGLLVELFGFVLKNVLIFVILLILFLEEEYV